MWQRQIESLLGDADVKISRNADTSALTSIRCGGKVRLLLEPETLEAFSLTVKALKSLGAQYRIIGGMSNTLPPDGLYDGALVRTQRINRVAFTENNRVTAEAGASLSSLARLAAQRSLGGLEELSGIPGTVGGAIWGNAGANGRSISDLIHSVTAYDLEAEETVTFNAEALCFGYRESIFKSGGRYMILSAELVLTKGEESEILTRIKALAEKRRATQPLDMPSLGSIFKHPQGHFAPRLIEELGMKGVSIGGAMISKKHAGFIVNTGNATSKDVTDLVGLIKERVLSRYGILLEEEINILC